MKYRDKLLLFNSQMLLNKREVLESFEGFISHHMQPNNGEGYCGCKRKALLSLCDKFKGQLLQKSIPNLTKHWHYYDYFVTKNSIRLDLLKCEYVEFNENDEISNMTSNMEHTLLEVTCDYLTVEQYAQQYGVTDTTVRQWIRRGKLRSAKKAGRGWLIPALADRPTRGFERVAYSWNVLPFEIIEEFPFLTGCNTAYIYQGDTDKKAFYCIAYDSTREDRQKCGLDAKDGGLMELPLAGTIGTPGKTQGLGPDPKARGRLGLALASTIGIPEKPPGFELDAKKRERLELALISTIGITVDELSGGIQFVPGKYITGLPILYAEKMSNGETPLPFPGIVVRPNPIPALCIHADPPIGGYFGYEYPKPYLLPINWEFLGFSHEDGDMPLAAMNNGSYAKCKKIGTLSGRLIQCTQLIMDGYCPRQVCDNGPGDLGFIMHALSEEGAPLNGLTGDDMQDVLCIDELVIEKGLRRKGLGMRILQELPYFCIRLVNAAPDILVYYLSPLLKEEAGGMERSEGISAFYRSNGFVELGGNQILYTFTYV
jgi:excisionase family DNA binding protein